MVQPEVTGEQLFVSDPRDTDIKRLCSEILGVGAALEVLRSSRVIDGRTIRQVGQGFDLCDRWAELRKLADLRVKFIDEAGVFFDAKPYPAGAYRDHSPLMHEIRREGLVL